MKIKITIKDKEACDIIKDHILKTLPVLDDLKKKISADQSYGEFTVYIEDKTPDEKTEEIENKFPGEKTEESE